MICSIFLLIILKWVNLYNANSKVFTVLQVREILAERLKEESASELEISVYDTERNEKAKKHRRELVSVAFQFNFVLVAGQW